MPTAIPSPSAMTTWKKSDLRIFGTTFPACWRFHSMRLGRLTADAAIVLDGAVDASKPVARATPLLPGRADPPARPDLRGTVPPARRLKRRFPSFVDHAGPGVQYIER